jgi:hypothetical protein
MPMGLEATVRSTTNLEKHGRALSIEKKKLVWERMKESPAAMTHILYLMSLVADLGVFFRKRALALARASLSGS